MTWTCGSVAGCVRPSASAPGEAAASVVSAGPGTSGSATGLTWTASRASYSLGPVHYYIYIYVYIYICIYIYIFFVYIYIRMYMCIYIYIYGAVLK